MSEVRIEDTLAIDASAAEVWHALEDPAVHARWHPFVTEIAGDHRLGQVRTCSVLVGGKHGETEERCVVADPASRIGWSVEQDSTGFGRMVSNWRAGFSLTPRNGAAVVTAVSTFEPNNLLVRAMIPIIRRKFHKTQRAIRGGAARSARDAPRGCRGEIGRQPGDRHRHVGADTRPAASVNSPSAAAVCA